jgi:hypothetical protein
MTSHTEYVKDQTEDQLEHLIQVATQRLEVLQQGGWTRLWVVADYCNKGWFAQDEYAQATEFLGILARAHAKAGKPFELSIEQGKCRPAEAAGLFAETRAESARMAKLLAA